MRRTQLIAELRIRTLAVQRRRTHGPSFPVPWNGASSPANASEGWNAVAFFDTMVSGGRRPNAGRKSLAAKAAAAPGQQRLSFGGGAARRPSPVAPSPPVELSQPTERSAPAPSM